MEGEVGAGHDWLTLNPAVGGMRFRVNRIEKGYKVC
jgi:hypothetical protein